MPILAVFSVWFFVGVVMALVGVAGTMDLLSGKSVVIARLIPALRLLEQKKVRRTQKAAARKAGVIKACLLGTLVIMALVGVAVAITQFQIKESRFALAEVPDGLKVEHKTVVAFLETLEAGRLDGAMRYCQSRPLFKYRKGADAARKEGDGIRDSETGTILQAAGLSTIRRMTLADPARGPLIVELFDGFKLTWHYRLSRRPGDGKGADDPIELVRIDPPPPPATQPLLPLPELPATGPS